MLVLPFKRTEAQAAATFSIFGKLPNRADFVRVNATHPVAVELDELIQRAFERLVTEKNWQEKYLKTDVVDFQFVSKDQRYVMVGVLRPSGDQSGRLYPLVAAAILPRESVDGYTEVLPIAYEVFFDELREQVNNAIENSVEALSCRQYLEGQLRAHDTAGSADLDLAQNVVDRFMLTHPVGYLAELLDAGVQPATLEQALLNLAFYQAYLRRFDNPVTNQVVMLPLSGHKGKQALIASTWLAILTSLFPVSEMHNTRGSYLLLNRSSDNAQLVACFGRIQEKFINIMLGGALDQMVMLDLSSEQSAWKSHRMYAEVSYALGRLLSDPGLPISTLVGFMRDIGKKLENSI